MPERFEHRLRVRYNECDPQGIVFNANYFMYFDIALTELFRATIGAYERLLEQGSDLVVAEATARFIMPARTDDLLDIAIVPGRFGNSSMVSDIEIVRDGELLVAGRMVHVFVDATTLEKQRVPELVRRALEPYVPEPG